MPQIQQNTGLLWRELKDWDVVQTKQSLLLAVLAKIRLVFDNTKQGIDNSQAFQRPCSSNDILTA